MQVGKAVAGASDTIGRSGIKISETKNQHERLNEVLLRTSSLYEQAKADAASYQGRSIQLNNAVGDLRETFGLLVLSLAGGTTGLQNITKMVIYLTNQLTNSIPTIVAWKDQLLQAFSMASIQSNFGGMRGSLFSNLKIGNNGSSIGSLIKTAFTLQASLNQKAVKNLQMPPPPKLNFNPTSLLDDSDGKKKSKKSHHGKSEAEKEMDRLKDAAKSLKEGLRDISVLWKRKVAEALGLAR